MHTQYLPPTCCTMYSVFVHSLNTRYQKFESELRKLTPKLHTSEKNCELLEDGQQLRPKHVAATFNK